MTDEKRVRRGKGNETFRSVDIESIKKTDEGYEIDLKPNIVKEEGAEYHFSLRNGVYHILRNKRAIYTPARTKVTVFNEALAKRTVEHLNIYGREYESPYSIVNFVYSYLDFFKDQTKEELNSPILQDYENDWLLFTRESDPKKFDEWFPDHGSGAKSKEYFEGWLQTLTEFQTGAVIIFGAALSSVNTARLLSTTWNNANLNQLAKEYFKVRKNYSKISYNHLFWSEEDIARIFENYLFWQGLGI